MEGKRYGIVLGGTSSLSPDVYTVRVHGVEELVGRSDMVRLTEDDPNAYAVNRMEYIISSALMRTDSTYCKHDIADYIDFAVESEGFSYFVEQFDGATGVDEFIEDLRLWVDNIEPNDAEVWIAERYGFFYDKGTNRFIDRNSGFLRSRAHVLDHMEMALAAEQDWIIQMRERL
jgi:hypothetical protein